MMKIIYMTALAIISSFFMMPLSLLAETTSPSWEKIREEQGIVVYAQKSEDSEVIKVKTLLDIEAGIEEIQAFIEDLSKRKKWVPFLAEARSLKSYSVTERLEYTLFNAPWPSSDRDFVYRRQLIYKDKKKIIMKMTSEENELMPEQESAVRAELLEAQYTLLAVNDNKTKAELIFHADFKGWLPNWIVNKIQQALPFRMLQNLRAQVEKANSSQVSN